MFITNDIIWAAPGLLQAPLLIQSTTEEELVEMALIGWLSANPAIDLREFNLHIHPEIRHRIVHLFFPPYNISGDTLELTSLIGNNYYIATVDLADRSVKSVIALSKKRNLLKRDNLKRIGELLKNSDFDGCNRRGLFKLISRDKQISDMLVKYPVRQMEYERTISRIIVSFEGRPGHRYHIMVDIPPPKTPPPGSPHDVFKYMLKVQGRQAEPVEMTLKEIAKADAIERSRGWIRNDLAALEAIGLITKNIVATSRGLLKGFYSLKTERWFGREEKLEDVLAVLAPYGYKIPPEEYLNVKIDIDRILGAERKIPTVPSAGRIEEYGKEGTPVPEDLAAQDIRAYYIGEKVKPVKGRAIMLPVYVSKEFHVILKKGDDGGERIRFYLPKSAKKYYERGESGQTVRAALAEDPDYGVCIELSREGDVLVRYYYFEDLKDCTTADFSKMAFLDYILGNKNIHGDDIAPRVYDHRTAAIYESGTTTLSSGGRKLVVSQLHSLRGKRVVFVPVKDKKYGWRIHIHEWQAYEKNARRKPDAVYVRDTLTKTLVPLSGAASMVRGVETPEEKGPPAPPVKFVEKLEKEEQPVLNPCTMRGLFECMLNMRRAQQSAAAFTEGQIIEALKAYNGTGLFGPALTSLVEVGLVRVTTVNLGRDDQYCEYRLNDDAWRGKEGRLKDIIALLDECGDNIHHTLYAEVSGMINEILGKEVVKEPARRAEALPPAPKILPATVLAKDVETSPAEALPEKPPESPPVKTPEPVPAPAAPLVEIPLGTPDKWGWTNFRFDEQGLLKIGGVIVAQLKEHAGKIVACRLEGDTLVIKVTDPETHMVSKTVRTLLDPEKLSEVKKNVARVGKVWEEAKPKPAGEEEKTSEGAVLAPAPSLNERLGEALSDLIALCSEMELDMKKKRYDPIMAVRESRRLMQNIVSLLNGIKTGRDAFDERISEQTKTIVWQIGDALEECSALLDSFAKGDKPHDRLHLIKIMSAKHAFEKIAKLCNEIVPATKLVKRVEKAAKEPLPETAVVNAPPREAAPAPVKVEAAQPEVGAVPQKAPKSESASAILSPKRAADRIAGYIIELFKKEPERIYLPSSEDTAAALSMHATTVMRCWKTVCPILNAQQDARIKRAVDIRLNSCQRGNIPLGVYYLENLIKKVDCDWAKASKEGEVPNLAGLSVGKTNGQGAIDLIPYRNFCYRWHALGVHEEDWEGFITESGVKDRSFCFTVKFTKDNAEVYHNFRIGPGTWKMCGSNKVTGHKKTVLNIFTTTRGRTVDRRVKPEEEVAAIGLIIDAYEGKNFKKPGIIAKGTIMKGAYGHGTCQLTVSKKGGGRERFCQFHIPKEYMEQGALGKIVVIRIERDINHGQIINLYLEEEFDNKGDPKPVITYKYFADKVKHYKTGDKKGVCVPVDLAALDIRAYYCGRKVKPVKGRAIMLPVQYEGVKLRAELRAGRAGNKKIIFSLSKEAKKYYDRKKTSQTIRASFAEDPDYGVYIELSREGTVLSRYYYFEDLEECTTADFSRMALLDYVLGNENIHGKEIAPREYRHRDNVVYEDGRTTLNYRGRELILGNLKPLKEKEVVFVPVTDKEHGWLIHVHEWQAYEKDKGRKPDAIFVRDNSKKTLVPLKPAAEAPPREVPSQAQLESPPQPATATLPEEGHSITKELAGLREFPFVNTGDMRREATVHIGPSERITIFSGTQITLLPGFGNMDVRIAAERISDRLFEITVLDANNPKQALKVFQFDSSEKKYIWLDSTWFKNVIKKLVTTRHRYIFPSKVRYFGRDRRINVFFDERNVNIHSGDAFKNGEEVLMANVPEDPGRVDVWPAGDRPKLPTLSRFYDSKNRSFRGRKDNELLYRFAQWTSSVAKKAGDTPDPLLWRVNNSGRICFRGVNEGRILLEAPSYKDRHVFIEFAADTEDRNEIRVYSLDDRGNPEKIIRKGFMDPANKAMVWMDDGRNSNLSIDEKERITARLWILGYRQEPESVKRLFTQLKKNPQQFWALIEKSGKDKFGMGEDAFQTMKDFMRIFSARIVMEREGVLVDRVIANIDAKFTVRECKEIVFTCARLMGGEEIVLPPQELLTQPAAEAPPQKAAQAAVFIQKPKTEIFIRANRYGKLWIRGKSFSVSNNFAGRRLKIRIVNGTIDRSRIVIVDNAGNPVIRNGVLYAVDLNTGQIRCHLPKKVPDTLLKELDNVRIEQDRLNGQGCLMIANKAVTVFQKHPNTRVTYEIRGGKVDRTTLLLVDDNGQPLKKDGLLYVVSLKTGKIKCHIPEHVHPELLEKLDDVRVEGYTVKDNKTLVLLGSIFLNYGNHPAGTKVTYEVHKGKSDRSTLLFVDKDGSPLDHPYHAIDLTTGKIRCHLPAQLYPGLLKLLDNVRVGGYRLPASGVLTIAEKYIIGLPQYSGKRISFEVHKGIVNKVSVLEDDSDKVIHEEIISRPKAIPGNPVIEERLSRLDSTGHLRIDQRNEAGFGRYPNTPVKFKVVNGVVDKTTILLLDDKGNPLKKKGLRYTVDLHTGEIRCHLPNFLPKATLNALDDVRIEGDILAVPYGALNVGGRTFASFYGHGGKGVTYEIHKGAADRASILIVDDKGRPLEEKGMRYAISLKTGKIKCHIPTQIFSGLLKVLDGVSVEGTILSKTGALTVAGKHIFTFPRKYAGKRVSFEMHKGKLTSASILADDPSKELCKIGLFDYGYDYILKESRKETSQAEVVYRPESPLQEAPAPVTLKAVQAAGEVKLPPRDIGRELQEYLAEHKEMSLPKIIETLTNEAYEGKVGWGILGALLKNIMEDASLSLSVGGRDGPEMQFAIKKLREAGRDDLIHPEPAAAVISAKILNDAVAEARGGRTKWQVVAALLRRIQKEQPDFVNESRENFEAVDHAIYALRKAGMADLAPAGLLEEDGVAQETKLAVPAVTAETVTKETGNRPVAVRGILAKPARVATKSDLADGVERGVPRTKIRSIDDRIRQLYAAIKNGRGNEVRSLLDILRPKMEKMRKKGNVSPILERAIAAAEAYIVNEKRGGLPGEIRGGMTNINQTPEKELLKRIAREEQRQIDRRERYRGLRKLSDKEELALGLLEDVLSLAFNKKLVLAFDSDIAVGQTGNPIDVIRALKENPKYKTIMKNVEILIAPPDTLASRLAGYKNSDDMKVFLFASGKSRGLFEKIEPNVYPTYVEGNFPSRALDPLPEIVALSLARYFGGFALKEEPVTEIKAGDETLYLKDVNIESIRGDGLAMIVRRLPNAKELETGEIQKEHAILVSFVKFA